jgi:hypothetical protein
MTHRAIAIALLALSVGSCVKHGRSHPQIGPAPDYSLSSGQRLAIASMLGQVLVGLPNSRVLACVSFRKLEHGYYYAYSPDTTLLRMLWGHHRVVGPDQCPPTRNGAFRVFDPNDPEPPRGYVDPYSVRVDSQQYGRNEAAATIVVYQSSYEWTHQCTARRVSRNNWVATCRGVSQVILSDVPAAFRDLASRLVPTFGVNGKPRAELAASAARLRPASLLR